MDGLVVKDLCKSYRAGKTKIEVNKNVSITVPHGSLVWIYGNSGSGKSTFLNMLSAIDKSDSGSINWDGFHLNNMKSSERSTFRLNNCGLIFQFFELIKAQNVYNNASFPLKVQRKSKREIDAILSPLFEYFGLEALKNKMPHSLSGGEKQRVSIIRAMSTSPKYIIADEITSSLDVNNSHKVYDYLKKYIKETGGIGIFVSHDEIIKDYVDSSYKMQDGSLTS